MVVPKSPPASSRKLSHYAPQLRALGVIGVLFLLLQCFDVLGISFYTGLVLNFFKAQFLQDPAVIWVTPYYESFPFSMKPSEECRKVLDNKEILRGIAKAYADDEKAQTKWLSVIEACHGPLPTNDRDAMEELSLKNFWKKLKTCGTGDGCLPEWRDAIKGKGPRQLEKLFVDSARCALRTEFPLNPKISYDAQPTMRQKKPAGWKPKRVLLLSVTLGAGGPTMACKLVATALTRGWNLTLVEGPLRGLEYKYSDALAALHGLLEMEPNIAAQDTMVVFVDSRDMLMQQSPTTLVRKYLDQPYEFVLSAEQNCYPMGEFPHTIGAKDYMCDHLFPYADAHGIRSGPQYVNTGGWMATANAAVVVLKELIQFMQRHAKTDGNCLRWGKDQMLGSVAFLRHRHLIGLDVNYEIFSGGSWGLIDEELTLQASSNRTTNNAYCHHEHHQCPGMLHFNGGSSDGGTLQSAFEKLTSRRAIKQCPSSLWGSLTVVRRTKGTVRTVYRDLHLEQPGRGSEWNKCLTGKACFGK